MRHKLSRRLLPFYMKTPILLAFTLLSLFGQILGVAALYRYPRIDLRWCAFGFGLGVALGFMQGKWTSRLWRRAYLKVIKREITFWQAQGAKSLTCYTVLALGTPVFTCILIQTLATLAGLQCYVFGFIGAMNFALLLWVRQLPK